MAEAVRQAIETGEHLAVQAGTGTGKSLAYLVPAVRHALTTGSTVVVATATIALQRQLIDRDLPRLVTALAPLLDREPSFAILKGRRNYLCLHRQQRRRAPRTRRTRCSTRRLCPIGRAPPRRWDGRSSGCTSGPRRPTTGDRDELVPGVPEAAWRQVSVSAQECIGAQRCPFGSRCFAERARDAAARADIVVTNHALLAIDATSDIDVLPEHNVVIVDEAHDLVDRVTSATTGELSGPAVDTAARRAGRLTESAATEGGAGAPAVADQLRHAAAALAIDLGDAPAGRMDVLSDALAATLTSVQDAAGACADAVRASAASEEEDPQRMATARMTLASLDELQRTASRILDAFGEQITERGEVVWLDRPPATRRAGRRRCGWRRSRSAGCCGPGCSASARWRSPRPRSPSAARSRRWPSSGDCAGPAGRPPRSPPLLGGPIPRPPWGGQVPRTLSWKDIDVGSPFDHPRSGILYVARHLPPPGRDQLPEAYLTELEELIDAAGGRTLGLFSSMRAATRGGRGAPRADQPPAALPGRRPHRPAGQAVHRGRADLPVRHAVAVAGRGRAGELAAARRHRPDPVPAARRPARLGPAARGGRPRRQRVHDGRGVAGRAAAGPGRRPAAADDDRPRRGGGPRSAADDRPLRRLPPRVAAPVLDHHRPRPRPRRPAPPGRCCLTRSDPLRAGYCGRADAGETPVAG